MSTMDFTDTIETFLTGTSYVVTRTAPRTVGAGGRAGSPSTSTINIRASIQQASGRDLEVLPEANSALEAIKIYTATALKTGGDDAEADTLVYRSRTYEVRHVERHDELGNYFKAIASLVLP